MTKTDLSVIVPCHNVASTLREQLDALVAERWDRSWEIVVVDNASTDATARIAGEYFDAAVPVRVVPAFAGRGVAYARNTGAHASDASWIAFCDGDDVVLPGWVASIGAALEDHPFVSSRLDPTILNPGWLATSRPLPVDGLPRFGGMPFAHGGACGMHRALWTQIGGYDSAFDGVEDIEFAMRARAVGVVAVRADSATVAYRLRGDLRSVWRQGVAYGRRRPVLARRAQELGLTLSVTSGGLKSLAWLVAKLPTVVHRRGRFAWVWTLANRSGVAVGHWSTT